MLTVGKTELGQKLVECDLIPDLKIGITLPSHLLSLGESYAYLLNLKKITYLYIEQDSSGLVLFKLAWCKFTERGKRKVLISDIRELPFYWTVSRTRYLII